MTITLNLLTILIIVVGVLAIFDGVTRLRGNRVSSILAIVEIILGALILLTFFFSIGIPLLFLAIALEVVFIILIVTRGTGRGRGYLGVTAVAAILNLILILRLLNVLVIPGVL